MFVNAIYLYDDKMTLVFNSGDDPVTIDDFLLSEIEENFQHMEKGLFLNKVSPPETHQNSKRMTVGFSIPFLTSKLAMHN